MTKCHRLDGLNRNLSITVLEAKKSEIKVPGSSVPSEGLPASCPCVLTGLFVHVEREGEKQRTCH